MFLINNNLPSLKTSKILQVAHPLFFSEDPRRNQNGRTQRHAEASDMLNSKRDTIETAHFIGGKIGRVKVVA